MRHEDAAKVVLVRAVEETLPDRLAPEVLLEAHAAAGDPTTGGAWIVRRGGYLFDAADTVEMIHEPSLVPLTRAAARLVEWSGGQTAAGMRAAVTAP